MERGRIVRPAAVGGRPAEPNRLMPTTDLCIGQSAAPAEEEECE
jgi:hypothetical protein